MERISAPGMIAFSLHGDVRRDRSVDEPQPALVLDDLRRVLLHRLRAELAWSCSRCWPSGCQPQRAGWATPSPSSTTTTWASSCFGFVFFWGYIAFSQYMLIWYANMPEETQFYMPRQIGPWMGVSLALVVCHLLIPFFGLLSRHAKRRPGVLAFWACGCWRPTLLDLFWLVMPNLFMHEMPAGRRRSRRDAAARGAQGAAGVEPGRLPVGRAARRVHRAAVAAAGARCPWPS